MRNRKEISGSRMVSISMVFVRIVDRRGYDNLEKGGGEGSRDSFLVFG